MIARPARLTMPRHQQSLDGLRIDGEHVAEQERGGLGGERGVEMQEQQAEPERERQHEADGDVALGQALAEQAHADPGGDRHTDQAPERRDAEQDGAGGAREADMGQGVTGEALVAEHEEVADGTADQGDDGRSGEGGAHEVVLKHGRNWNERRPPPPSGRP